MNILAVESSCDDMSWAVVRNGKEVLSCHVFSQNELHGTTGGVVPEVAAREHVRQVIHVLRNAYTVDELRNTIDAIAVTEGPGLLGSLLIGISAAATLATFLKKPLIPVQHIEGHIASNWLERDEEDIRFPLVVLTVSGGHNDLYYMENPGHYEHIGTTQDDAAGEAFDKVARMLDLGYPGGPAIEKFLQTHSPTSVSDFRFPRSWKLQGAYDFSFSGLKSEVRRTVDKYTQQGMLDDDMKAMIAQEFQISVVEVLAKRLLQAGKDRGVHSLCISGGVAANEQLRTYIYNHALEYGFSSTDIFFPMKKVYCTDNAAMIGARAFQIWKYKKGSVCTFAEQIFGVKPMLQYRVE